MRFSPPDISPTPPVQWLLAAAFGPLPATPPVDADAVVDLARRFDLGPRIVARHGAARLGELLGKAAGEPVRAHRRGIAVALAIDLTARRVAALTAGHDLPVVFLKGYALQRLVAGPDGWRPYVDLDVLLARPAAERLQQLLRDDGWSLAAEDENPQHLPPMTSPESTMVDIHFRLRGVRVGTSRWATADELLAARLCRPAGLGDHSWLPARSVMAAHLAVHALEQHGHRPATYPLLRAVADIADLVADADPAGLAAAARRHLAGNLSREELDSLFRLAALLGEGRLPKAGVAADQGADLLLRHILAGILDPDYRQSLALSHTAGRLREARRDGMLMRYIAHKLKGSQGGSEGAEGHPGSFSRRLFHPIRLSARFAAAAVARLRRALDR